jgi:hypothetical protein
MPQPVKDAAVFFMRMIVHNWPNNHARKILRLLRKAAAPDTKLLVADYILPLACKLDIDQDISVDGLVVEGEPAIPPAPLLPNMGEANKLGYLMDCVVSADESFWVRALLIHVIDEGCVQ